MLGIRSPYAQEWDIDDAQFDAVLVEDENTGQLQMNANIEQALIQTEVGRTANQLVFDVKPLSYTTNVQQLESAKYILQSFIDKEDFYDTYRTWKQDKARYGTGIWFTGLRFEVEYIPEYAPQDVDENIIGNGFFSTKFEDKRKENWFFTPQNVPIRAFFMDDRKIYQNDFNQVEDCVMLETLTPSQFVAKYKGVPGVNDEVVDQAQPIAEDNPKYGIPAPKGMIILYHYFNRSTKKYIIVVNRTLELYVGKIPYSDGRLPFDVCQHYPDSACMYGIGICRAARPAKAFKNNLLQSIMDGARLGSGKILAIGASGENIDGDWSVASGGISIARMTTSINELKDVDTRVDITGSVTAMNIMENELKMATGIDLNAPFEVMDQEKLGQTEIREANKAIRHKSTDELMNQSIDRVFTATLNNIKTFAPQLLKSIQDMEGANGKKQKLVQWPKIQISNVTIQKVKGIQSITEDYGNYGFLELTPQTIEGDMTVHVTTPSTYNEMMGVVEKNKINDLVNNVMLLEKAYPPEMIQQIIPLQQIWDKMKKVYDFEDGKFVADTKKDIIQKKNEEKLNALKQLTTTNLLSPNRSQNAQSQGGLNA